MKETAKTLAVLKTRWREVVLIIATQFLGLVLLNVTSSVRNTMASAATLVSAVTFLAIYAFDLVILFTSITLLSGFERTVYLGVDKPQSPILLWRVGKQFLLRYFAAMLLLGLIYMILIWLVFLITKPFFRLDTGLFETIKMYPFTYIFNSSVASILLAKLVLFIPAVIIVYDCKLFRSLYLFRQHRLRDAKELFFLYIVLVIGGNLLWALGLSPNNATTVLHYILMIAYFIIRHFLWLTIITTAVLFVGRCSSITEKVEEE